MKKHVGTFCGIGGFHLAAQWAGWENVFSCEINPFSRRYLEYYWPGMYHHDDIFTLTGKKIIDEIEKKYGYYDPNEIVFSGGFPCQPFSTAGKRKGSADDRHLWPETRRVIDQHRPGVAVLENVTGLLSILEPKGFSEMEKKALQLFREGSTDAQVVSIYERFQRRTIGIIIEQLEEIGYELPRTRSGEPVVLCVPACSVNAPHRRDRVWFVAYANDVNRRARTGRENRQEIGDGSERLTPNPHDPGSDTPGHGTNANGQAQGQERGREPQCRAGGPGSRGLASDAKGIHRRAGLCSENNKGRAKQGAFIDNGNQPTDWQRFPTQPPVLPGNDGLSAPVAGYTARQWYEEHIRAAGNAIVPQVALQIFKAIERSSFLFS